MQPLNVLFEGLQHRCNMNGSGHGDTDMASSERRLILTQECQTGNRARRPSQETIARLPHQSTKTAHEVAELQLWAQCMGCLYASHNTETGPQRRYVVLIRLTSDNISAVGELLGYI